MEKNAKAVQGQLDLCLHCQPRARAEGSWAGSSSSRHCCAFPPHLLRKQFTPVSSAHKPINLCHSKQFHLIVNLICRLWQSGLWRAVISVSSTAMMPLCSWLLLLHSCQPGVPADGRGRHWWQSAGTGWSRMSWRAAPVLGEPGLEQGSGSHTSGSAGLSDGLQLAQVPSNPELVQQR